MRKPREARPDVDSPYAQPSMSREPGASRPAPVGPDFDAVPTLPPTGGAIQMIRAGFVPSNPNAWRKTTRLTTNANLGGIDGGNSFSAAQSEDVRDNNTGRAPNVALNLNATLADDADNTALLPRDVASQRAPEIDHIVPRAQWGANDSRNARVLSKDNNTGPVGRPRLQQGEVRIAVYEDIQLKANRAAGALLSRADITDLRNKHGDGSKAANPRAADLALLEVSDDNGDPVT